MATTTNYGWTTPDDTALVKDGAAAIRTLGSSVDTTTKNLNPSTTLGDIEYRSSTANVNTRLGLGTAGQVLQVNSGANAPEWATPSSGGMTLISTTTISNAEVLLTSIPQIYNELVIILRDFLPNTDGQNLRLRFNDDSGANRHSEAVDFYGGEIIFDKTSSRLTAVADNTVADGLLSVSIPDYANSSTFKWFVATGFNYDTSGTNIYPIDRIGAINQTTAI